MHVHTHAQTAEASSRDGEDDDEGLSWERLEGKTSCQLPADTQWMTEQNHTHF